MQEDEGVGKIDQEAGHFTRDFRAAEKLRQDFPSIPETRSVPAIH
jgi:hypothetical protein